MNTIIEIDEFVRDRVQKFSSPFPLNIQEAGRAGRCFVRYFRKLKFIIQIYNYVAFCLRVICFSASFSAILGVVNANFLCYVVSLTSEDKFCCFS